MILTLNAACLKSQIQGEGGGKPKISLNDLPAYTREVLGLRGLNLSTSLLAGADRAVLERIRERADKAGCACLVLIEPTVLKIGDADDDAAEGIVQRMHRVVQAAQILGCSGSAFHLAGMKGDAARDAASRRLKKVVEKAERLDVNVLVAPALGDPAEPENITDLLKKVGGFRIGTYPDFETAAQSKDPVAYLRRLSPYASAIYATTMLFKDDEVIVVPARKRAKAPPATEPVDEAKAGTPAPAKGKKRGKAAAEPPPPPPPPSPPPEEEEDDDDELGLEELEEALREEGLIDDVPPEPIPVHAPWNLAAMVAAVSSVGYDGPLSVDYRGKGDVTLGIENSRKALQAALDGVLSGA